MFSILCNLLQNKVYLKPALKAKNQTRVKENKIIHKADDFAYAGEQQTYERFKFRTVI